MLPSALALLLLQFAASAHAALDVDLSNADSIKSAAKLVAANLWTYYMQQNKPGNTPCILLGPPPAGPYYWWQAGAMFGTYLDYSHWTGDSTYDDETAFCLIFQAAPPQYSYMHRNWTSTMGNDDQGFWGMSALLAAENGFRDPPSDQPGWLALAQAVFNLQAGRWEDADCGGGLRWQVFAANGGYDYKNTISNSIFFNMGARLAHYTGNDTYAEWADRAYTWMADLKYISDEWDVYDGAHIPNNCTEIDKAQFSYNAASLTQGAAFMYHHYQLTGETAKADRWKGIVTSLVNRTIEFFFQDGIIVEMPCERPEGIFCNTDQHSFKGYMHRWLVNVAQLCVWLHDPILATLKTSAAGAMRACNPDGSCGFQWTTGSYDGDTGAGQQMSALAALSSVMFQFQPAEGGGTVSGPLTNATGGTSQGDPAAGQDVQPPAAFGPITGKDRGGAGFLTFVLCSGMLGAVVWMGL